MKKLQTAGICLWLILSLTACAAAPSQSTPPSITTTVSETTLAETPPATTIAPSMTEVPQGQLTLSAINVGKGDCLLITTPEDGRYLVDTGTVEHFPDVVRGLAALGVSRLDGIFLTHGHKDHMGGLENLLASYPVGRVYVSALDTVTYKTGQIEGLCAAKNVPVEKVKAGDRIVLGGALLDVLAPTALSTQEENDNSLVMRLVYGDVAMLLMGDATSTIEQGLTASGTQLSAQVLKAGHHGKDDATSDAFLRAVSPEYVILTGDPTEDDESPGKRVIRLLDEADIPSFETSGSFIAVSFTTDGQSLQWAYTAEADRDNSLEGLALTAIDRKAEWVQLRNDSDKTLDLSGCWLFSENGGETYFFPQGTALAPGTTLTVISGDLAQQSPAAHQLVWTSDKVWKAKKGDAALLYDAQGRLISQLD